MSATIIPGLQHLLGHAGFSRRGGTWNRRRAGLVDVFNLQESKAGDGCFVNLGVCDPPTFEACWGRSPFGRAGFVDEADCQARARFGDEELRGPSFWYYESAVASEVTLAAFLKHIHDAALPWFDQLGSPADLAKHLQQRSAETSKYPLPAIYLAILLHRQGDAVRSEVILEDVEARAAGWANRVRGVRTRLVTDTRNPESPI